MLATMEHQQISTGVIGVTGLSLSSNMLRVHGDDDGDNGDNTEQGGDTHEEEYEFRLPKRRKKSKFLLETSNSLVAGGDQRVSFEYTPTSVVAGVCTVIVAISLAAERVLHYAGKFLISKKQVPLSEGLLKIKEGDVSGNSGKILSSRIRNMIQKQVRK